MSKAPCPYSPAAYVNAVLADRRFTDKVYGAGIRLLHALADFQKDRVNGDVVFPSEIAWARRERIGSVNTVAAWRRRFVGLGLLRAWKARVRTGRLCWHYRLVLPKNIPPDDAGPTEAGTARYLTDRAQPSVPPAKDGPLRATTARYLLDPASMEGLGSAVALRRVAGGPTAPDSHPAAPALASVPSSPSPSLRVACDPLDAACGGLSQKPAVEPGRSGARRPPKYCTSRADGPLQEHEGRRGRWRGKVGVVQSLKSGFLAFDVPGERSELLGHVLHEIEWLAEDAWLPGEVEACEAHVPRKGE